jgi:hypothetical protein
MEAIFNAVNRPRPRVLGMNEKLIEFLRTKPPTFGGSVNPLDADDWLRAILRELEPFNCEDRDKVLLAAHQLTRTALAWWENYYAAAKDPSAITWDEFVEEFRRYHIPEATLKQKADEFHETEDVQEGIDSGTEDPAHPSDLPRLQHPHEHGHTHRESQGRRKEREQAQVHGAQGQTTRALPEAEKL